MSKVYWMFAKAAAWRLRNPSILFQATCHRVISAVRLFKEHLVSSFGTHDFLHCVGTALPEHINNPLQLQTKPSHLSSCQGKSHVSTALKTEGKKRSWSTTLCVHDVSFQNVMFSSQRLSSFWFVTPLNAHIRGLAAIFILFLIQYPHWSMFLSTPWKRYYVQAQTPSGPHTARRQSDTNVFMNIQMKWSGKRVFRILHNESGCFQMYVVSNKVQVA